MHIQSLEYIEAMKIVAANEDLMGKLLPEREKELLSGLNISSIGLLVDNIIIFEENGGVDVILNLIGDPYK